jgi:group I intron endonuclease
VYILIDPIANQVRYVGISKDPSKRFKGHLFTSNLIKNTHKNNWIKKLKSCGMKPTLSVIEQVSFDEWPAKERYWIKYYKDIGCDLTNATIGGEGVLEPSEETRQKIRNAFLGRKLTQEQKDKISKAHKGKKLTEEHKAAIGLSGIGRVQSLDSIAKRNGTREKLFNVKVKSIYDEMIELYIGGASQLELVRKFHVSKDTVRQILLNANIIIRDRMVAVHLRKTKS